MHELLCEAIKQRQVLHLCYDDGYQRIVEPHFYGETHGGNRLLRVFQREGFSTSNEQRGWKTLRLEAIFSVEVTEKTFEQPRPGYNPGNNTSIAHFFAKLPTKSPEEWLEELLAQYPV